MDCKDKDEHYKELLKEKSSIQVALNDALVCEEKHKERVLLFKHYNGHL